MRRAGDECVIPAGAILCREDRIGYWFFVVSTGSVRLTREGRECATIGAGGHLGDLSILGFGPQPMTATAITDVSAFVLGRKPLLDLSALLPSLQQGLFPDVAADAYARQIRRLRDEGAAAWRLQPQGQQPGLERADTLPTMLRVFPAKEDVGPKAGFASVALGRAVAPRLRVPVPRLLSWRATVACTVASVAALLALGFGYHPNVLVVHPTTGIDITNDVRVNGTTVRRPTGRFVLTAVKLEQPTVFGAALARARGRETVPRAEHPARLLRAGRRDYLESQRRAAAVVAGEAGLDLANLDITFVDRHLSGGSAGLVYALLLADITGRIDLGGRVIAATGVLGPDGGVEAVGFVDEKGVAAERAGAIVFFVPRAGRVPRHPRHVLAVESFDAALDALARGDEASGRSGDTHP